MKESKSNSKKKKTLKKHEPIKGKKKELEIIRSRQELLEETQEWDRPWPTSTESYRESFNLM